MTKAKIQINRHNGNTLDGYVDESDTTQCGLCGNDLYVHEWITMDADGDVVDCDRNE